jgi:hypothetical protein
VDFEAVWSEATKKKTLRAKPDTRGARCNRALQSKLVVNFEAVWSEATKTKTRLSRG